MTLALHIPDDHFVCDLAADTPAAEEVQAGTVLSVRCRSALDCQVGAGPVRAAGYNPATGPIAVAGARPGQAMRVDILDIQPDSPGHVSADWDGGTQAIEIRDGHALFHGIAVPIAPMIGVLGVAPAAGAGAWSTMDAGCFGGNMDTNDIAPGATVLLPIHQPGGGLVLGDVHAVMGDGEIGGQGLECPATVTLRVGIEPDPPSDHIVIYRRDRVMIVAAAERIEDAVRDAATAMMKLIARSGAMDEFQAMKLLGLAGETLFGQHGCRTKTVRVAVPLALVPGLRPRGWGRTDGGENGPSERAIQ
jgi:amidase